MLMTLTSLVHFLNINYLLLSLKIFRFGKILSWSDAMGTLRGQHTNDLADECCVNKIQKRKRFLKNGLLVYTCTSFESHQALL